MKPHYPLKEDKEKAIFGYDVVEGMRSILLSWNAPWNKRSRQVRSMFKDMSIVSEVTAGYTPVQIFCRALTSACA